MHGCTWEVWRALKKLELLLAAPRATLTLLSCSPNFPHASITRYTHALSSMNQFLNTTRSTVNRLARKELHLNPVVPERSKEELNLYIELPKHKLDQIVARNIRISLEKPIAFSK